MSLKWSQLPILNQWRLGAQKTIFFCLFCLVSFASPIFAEQVSVDRIELEGLYRTNKEWLKGYLGLNCPCTLTKRDIEQLRIKLLTTQVFQEVKVTHHSKTEQEDESVLRIEIKEKWTTIPVVRGAIGGGTPLFVAGIYDTHVFGSLWTLGGETRRYGSSPFGGVVWARAPRWLDGKHFVNFELWQDNRIRDLYSDSGHSFAQLESKSQLAVSEVLHPVTFLGGGSWQIGLRLQFRRQQELQVKNLYEDVALKPRFQISKTDQKSSLFKLVYDDLSVIYQDLSGLRLLINIGMTGTTSLTHRILEGELFWYKLWADSWNLCFHFWLGVNENRNYQSIYFLGGFDSVRGLPDGLMSGNQALYSNVELRKMLFRTKYVWWQAAFFTDFGTAGYRQDDLLSLQEKSYGLGIRAAIPQVNRLVFRFDYAQSFEKTGGSFSFGMNQFIDPFRPL